MREYLKDDNANKRLHYLTWGEEGVQEGSNVPYLIYEQPLNIGVSILSRQRIYQGKFSNYTSIETSQF